MLLRYLKPSATVCAYTARCLTHLEFPGHNYLSESHKNDRCVAGLWKGNLLSGLAWCALGDPIDWSRTVPPRAPTWSWASVEGNTSWDTGTRPDFDTEREAFAHSYYRFHGFDQSLLEAHTRITLDDIIAVAIRYSVSSRPNPYVKVFISIRLHSLIHQRYRSLSTTLFADSMNHEPGIASLS